MKFELDLKPGQAAIFEVALRLPSKHRCNSAALGGKPANLFDKR
jgi:hypothetical protein